MRSIFSRLYARGERGGRSQLEDYTTEVFAGLFERLGDNAKRSILHALLGESASSKFDRAFPVLDGIELATQVVLDGIGRGKRPDMVLRLGGRDVLVIEAKIGAALARHVDREESTADDSDPVTVDQLRTYAEWIAERNRRSDAWPGAVVLLTAWTPPPEGFPNRAIGGVHEAVRTWSQVAGWIVSWSAELDPVPRAFGADLLSFLQEKRLMDRHFNARDLAALTFFTTSSRALEHTFRTVIRGVAEAFPALGPYRHTAVGTDGDLGFYLGWIYLSANLQPRGAKLYVAVGLCAEPGPAFDKDSAEAASGGPFFLVYFADEYQKHKTVERVSVVPEGWTEMTVKPALVASRPFSEFSGDPDRRAEELNDLARGRIGKLCGVMDGYVAVEPAETEE